MSETSYPSYLCSDDNDYKNELYIKNGTYPDESDILAIQKLLKFIVRHKNSDCFMNYYDHFSDKIDLDFDNNILLELAVDFDNDTILKYLIERGLDIGYSNNYLIKKTVFRKMSTFQLLVDNGADIYVDDNIVFKKAVLSDHHDKMLTLIKLGVDPSFDNNEIFNYITVRHCDDASSSISEKESTKYDYCYITLKLLVDNGVNPLINYENLFNRCVCSGNYNLIKFFISKGANLESIKAVSLLNCIKSNNACSIKLLVENGVDFSSINEIEILHKSLSPQYAIYQSLSNTDIDKEILVKILTNYDKSFSRKAWI